MAKTKKKVQLAKRKSRSNKKKSRYIRKRRVEKMYDINSVKEALDAVKKGQTFREAADTFGVPKSTLFRKLKSQIIDCKKGAPTILTADKEEDFVS